MKVITLCGSTKFKEQFEAANAYLTLQGNVVISVGFFEQSEGISITKEHEALFEIIHLQKIDMADEIFVIDVDGYIGSSTRKEIEYANNCGKKVSYFSESKLSIGGYIYENCRASKGE
ncbi:DUF4406 domain-containing protein [Neobacillus niacini]|uniref:DUF4406 domain-containing protein n=1 Tax=Neobacillus niacini TaxID=86668 RepID=UPI003B02AF9E